MTHFTPFTHNFLQSILSSIDSKDPVVANAWLDTLLDVIDLLPTDVLGKEVLEIAVSKSQPTQPTFSKLGACQLIGKLAMKLEKQKILSELLPTTQSLSQDPEWGIRASACTQLSMIAKGLSNSGSDLLDKASVSILLSMLVELSGDEEEAVRLVAVETSSSILHLLDKECITVVMVPLLRKMSGSLKSEDRTLPMLALQWSRICRAIQEHLSEQDRQWFVEFYYQMASLGTNQQSRIDKPHMPDIVADTDNGQKLEIYAEVRHACAANCASMVSFIGAEDFARNIATLRILAADPHFVVRRAVAANLLELCRQLDRHAKVIHPVWIQLLIDPYNDVTCALVPQVGAIIELLTRLGPHGPFVETDVVVETCEAVLRCEEQVMNCSSWRLQADMLSQLAALPLCLPCNAVHDLLVPRLWHRIETSRPLPCRIAAAQTLMLCVRSERRLQERTTLCSNIVSKLILAPSCHLRMLFLRVCPILFDLLSRKFFRQHFFMAVVKLADDKVANVRLRFCSLLPHLHTSLRGLDLETEKQLIVQLDSAVRRLVETEKDRDVTAELTKFFGWIDQQEKKGPRITDEDVKEDRRKEEQENQWDSVEENLQSQQSGSSSQSLKMPFFASIQETQESAESEMEATPSTQEERPESLDPSTDDFYRDAGVRLTPAENTEKRALPKNSPLQTPASVSGSRIPSIQQRRAWSDKSDGSLLPLSRLRQPMPVSSKQQSSIAQFGIARTSQHVQPKPSIAYGISTAPSNVNSTANRVQRRSFGSTLQPNAKSRSQENLNCATKPRVARPVSTCLGSDLTPTSVNKSNFSRTRLRASVGAVPFKSGSVPPISTQAKDSKGQDGRLSFMARRLESGGKHYTHPKANEGGTVRLSDMKNALPSTPLFSRKLPGAAPPPPPPPPATRNAGSSVSTDTPPPLYARKYNPLVRTSLSPGKPSSSEGRLEQAAAELLAVLQSTTAKSTRLKRPAFGVSKSTTTQGAPAASATPAPVESPAAAAPASKGEGSGTGSCPTSPQNSRSSSPEPFQRRNQWRRSVHLISTNLSSGGVTPPPPPPRKSFGTPLVPLRSSNNNNNNINNNLSSNSNSKLPVPASTVRHATDLGSNA